MVREYTSENGYTGKMYGESTFQVTDRKGQIVYRTKQRTFHTFKQLVQHVETFPEYLRIMEGKDGISEKKEQ
jgi:hypothetical protein